MKLLVTGGTGFFGKALLKLWHSLHKSGEGPAAVTVLTRSPASFISRNPRFCGLPWLEFREGDICNPDSLPRGERFTHILHAATDSTIGPSLSPLERFDQIVNGTRNLLDFAIESKCERFLLTSSGGVYGPQPASLERIPETWCGMPDPLFPQNAYSVGKRVAEHLCALYFERYELNVTVARCFAFIGEDLPLDVHFAIGNFIRNALEGSEIRVQGDGTPIRSYLDQRDLAIWLTKILCDGAPNRAYNVGSDVAISIRDLAILVRDIVAPHKDVKILREQESNVARNRYVPDIQRARQELGLDVTIPLETAIKNVAEAVHASTSGG